MNEGVREWMPYRLGHHMVNCMVNVSTKHVSPHSQFCRPIRVPYTWLRTVGQVRFLCPMVIHSAGSRKIPREGPSRAMAEPQKNKSNV